MEKKYTIDWLYTTYKDFYDLYEIREDNFKTVYIERGCSVFDFAWYGFNLILSKIAEAYQAGTITEEKFYRSMKEVYCEMWQFLKLYEKKNALHVQGQYLFYRIKHELIEFPNIIGYEIFCVSCCDACNVYHKKFLKIEEAIKHAETTSTRCKHHYRVDTATVFIPIFP